MKYAALFLALGISFSLPAHAKVSGQIKIDGSSTVFPITEAVAEEFGKKLGAHKIWLITGKDWSENNFYQKLGFKKGGILPKHNFKKDYVIYSKFN